MSNGLQRQARGGSVTPRRVMSGHPMLLSGAVLLVIGPWLLAWVSPGESESYICTNTSRPEVPQWATPDPIGGLYGATSNPFLQPLPQDARLHKDSAVFVEGLKAVASSASEGTLVAYRSWTVIRLAQTAAPSVRREGDRLILPGPIQFKTSRTTVSHESVPTLLALASYLEAHPELRVALEVYGDTRGNRDMTLKLVTERAASLKEELVARNVDAGRIEPKGLIDDQGSYGRTVVVRVLDGPEPGRLERVTSATPAAPPPAAEPTSASALCDAFKQVVASAPSFFNPIRGAYVEGGTASFSESYVTVSLPGATRCVAGAEMYGSAAYVCQYDSSSDREVAIQTYDRLVGDLKRCIPSDWTALMKPEGAQIRSFLAAEQGDSIGTSVRVVVTEQGGSYAVTARVVQKSPVK